MEEEDKIFKLIDIRPGDSNDCDDCKKCKNCADCCNC